MRCLYISSGPRHVPHHTYCVRAPTGGSLDLRGVGSDMVGLDSQAKGPFFFVFCVFCMVFLRPGSFWGGLEMVFFGTCKLYWNALPSQTCCCEDLKLGAGSIFSWCRVIDEEDIRSTGFSAALHEELVFLTAPKWEIIRSFPGDMFDTMDTLWSGNYREVPDKTRDITSPLRSLAYPLEMTGWKTILSFEGQGNFSFGPC